MRFAPPKYKMLLQDWVDSPPTLFLNVTHICVTNVKLNLFILKTSFHLVVRLNIRYEVRFGKLSKHLRTPLIFDLEGTLA